MPPSKDQFYGSFKTKPLPKAEYRLFKALQDHYEIADTGDMLTLLLRLVYEVHSLKSGINGEMWFRQIIETWKDNLDEKRVYEL